MMAFQAADLTQDAAKTIFSDFQVTWPESRNFQSRWLPDEDDGILKAVIVTLKQNSTWLTNFPSQRIMHPEWLKLGAMGFRKGIKATLFHGKQLATIDRVVRAYAAKKGPTDTLDPSCTTETIDLQLKGARLGHAFYLL